MRFHGHELLEVLALESARAGSVVVGEDLGTVEPELRAALSDAGVLSTRVVWFEDGPPSDYPAQSLAMATTHDLPTIAGVWTGADEAELAALGRPVPPEGARAVRERLQRLVDLPDGAPVPESWSSAHARLSEGASALVLGTLEDACGAPAPSQRAGDDVRTAGQLVPPAAPRDRGHPGRSGVPGGCRSARRSRGGPVPRGD